MNPTFTKRRRLTVAHEPQQPSPSASPLQSREGLRLLQQSDAENRDKIEWLRGAVQEGINAMERGDYVTLDSPEAIKLHIRGLRTAKRTSN